MTEADDKTTGPPPGAGEPAATDPPPPAESQPLEEAFVYEEQVTEEYDPENPQAEGQEEDAGPIDDQIAEAAAEPEPEGESLEEFASKQGTRKYVYRRPDEWVPPKDFKPVIFTDKTNLVVEHENKSAKVTAIMLGIAVVIFGTLLGIYIYDSTHPTPQPIVTVPPPKVYLVPMGSTQPAKENDAPASTMPDASVAPMDINRR